MTFNQVSHRSMAKQRCICCIVVHSHSAPVDARKLQWITAGHSCSWWWSADRYQSIQKNKVQNTNMQNPKIKITNYKIQNRSQLLVVLVVSRSTTFKTKCLLKSSLVGGKAVPASIYVICQKKIPRFLLTLYFNISVFLNA